MVQSTESEPEAETESKSDIVDRRIEQINKQLDGIAGQLDKLQRFLTQMHKNIVTLSQHIRDYFITLKGLRNRLKNWTFGLNNAGNLSGKNLKSSIKKWADDSDMSMEDFDEEEIFNI